MRQSFPMLEFLEKMMIIDRVNMYMFVNKLMDHHQQAEKSLQLRIRLMIRSFCPSSTHMLIRKLLIPILMRETTK
jgi:hypothetical protein